MYIPKEQNGKAHPTLSLLLTHAALLRTPSQEERQRTKSDTSAHGVTSNVSFHAMAVRRAARLSVLLDGGRANGRGAVSSRHLEIPQSGGDPEPVHNRQISLHQERVPLPISVDERLQRLVFPVV